MTVPVPASAEPYISANLMSLRVARWHKVILKVTAKTWIIRFVKVVAKYSCSRKLKYRTRHIKLKM